MADSHTSISHVEPQESTQQLSHLTPYCATLKCPPKDALSVLADRALMQRGRPWSTTTPACKYSACLEYMLLYEVQGSDVSVPCHAGVSTTGRHHLYMTCLHHTSWHARIVMTHTGVDSPSSSRRSREARRRRAFLLVALIQHPKIMNMYVAITE